MIKVDFLQSLIFLYHTMVASENLLLQAVRNSRQKWLTDYFAKHLKEERGHHKWLAADLKEIGIDATKTEIPIAAAEMVGFVYYFIFHVNPVALLGYMKRMEGSPRSIEEIEQLEATYGAPLIRTLRWHAIHDIEHGKEIDAAIARLNDGEKKLVQQTFDICGIYLARAAQAIRIN